MKYKNIDSALHNFGDSFMGGLNYFDNDHVMYDVYKMAEKSKEKEITINFSNGATSHPELVTTRITKSIKHYMEHLPIHLKGQEVEAVAVNNVTLRVKFTRMGSVVSVEAEDDRGQFHHVSVK